MDVKVVGESGSLRGRIDALIGRISVGILVFPLEEDGFKSSKITFVNETAAKISAKDQLVGKRVLDVIPDLSDQSIALKEAAKNCTIELGIANLVFINPEKKDINRFWGLTDSHANSFRCKLVGCVNQIVLLFKQPSQTCTKEENDEVEELMSEASLVIAENDYKEVKDLYWKTAVLFEISTLGEPLASLKDSKSTMRSPYTTRRGSTDTKLRLGDINTILNLSDSEPDFIRDFLLTFRYHLTPPQLLTKIIIRFLSPHGFDQQERILDLIQNWIQDHWNDFQNDTSLLRTLQNFIKNVIPTSEAGQARLSLLRMLIEDRIGTTPDFVVELSHIPYNRRFKITNNSPQEVGQQITSITWDRFSKIKSHELTSQAWSKKNGSQIAPNIIEMINHTNRIARWVTSSIVSERNFGERTELLKFFISVLRVVYKLRDFNTVFSIVMGLEHSCISKLQHTWTNLDSTNAKHYQKISAIASFESNFKNYRTVIRKYEKARAIPNIGTYLKDLTFIEDGNTSVDDTGHVNMFKMKMVADTISQIQAFQKCRYDFPENQSLKATLLFDLLLLPEEMIFAASKELEPKPVQLRVLVADDNRMNQKVCLKLLERLNHKVINFASSGREVLKELENTIYDVILMDSMMPDLSGVETTEIIRKTLPLANQPFIIALTAKAKENKEKFNAAGINDVLPKPINLKILEGALLFVKKVGKEKDSF